MTKRRDFIKRSIAGAVAVSASGLTSCKTAGKEPAAPAINYQNDPGWQKMKYGEWGGPGVFSEPGPMDKILLKDWAPRSSVVTKETAVEKAAFPVIDNHIHIVGRTPEEISQWVRTMDETGVETSVVLTGATGAEFDSLVDPFLRTYPGRFRIYCGIDMNNIEDPSYPDRVAAELTRCHEKGATGVGEVSDKGWGINNTIWANQHASKDANKRPPDIPRDKRLHIDDPRLDVFWKRCGELGMPVSLHVADHPSCWTPLDIYQERTPDYQHFNQYGKDIDSFDELIKMRNRTLEKHPGTVFIACHLGNLGHDLERLSGDMNLYPNLYLDLSARDYEIGRTPRAAAAFLTKYKDRIVFGTDMGREAIMYRSYWRLLETADEYIPGRVGWRYYGLDLPKDVLEAIYRGTALKIQNT